MPFVTPETSGSRFAPSLLSFWKRLALTTDQADPVCCAPVWNLTYHKVATPFSRIFYATNESSMILLREDLVSFPGIPCLYPIESGWMFCKSLLGVDAPNLLADVMPELAREYGRMPVLVLGGVQRNRRETRALYNNFSNFYSFYITSRSIQCSASLEGGFDGWAENRSANCRAKLRKAARKARAQNINFERSRPETEAESRSVYARMLDVERRSWKGINRCGITESPSTEFYAELLKRLAQEKAAYIIFAKRENQDIGFIFGGSAGRVYRGQQFSYDNNFKDLSIGNLMQLEKVKWLCELGFLRYDMGPITGPRMGYKASWTENRYPLETWILRK